ncbi:phospholipase D family protein [uncultured Bartonella sp.]|uniref:phospholipase D family protein n=1 Tax=uncultured Bartonella sp. TaxID=104108 RepID=UPI002616B1E1|nr:phospholipase D family protein [uncultured Bartonella sp.]
MTIVQIIIGLIVVFAVASMLAVYAYGRFAKSARGESSFALTVKKSQTKIDRHIEDLAKREHGLGVENDGLSLFINNLDAFAGRAVGTKLSGRSLDLMYYIWDDDLTGRLLLNAVMEAADRGVRVRMLLDDINAQGRDPAYVALDKHPNIEVRMFNPGRARNGGLRRGLEMMLRALTVTRRMHNKAFIIDGRIAFVGGRNIADSYFGAGKASNFRDLDLMLVGPSVKKVETIFDSFWNSAVALPIHALTVSKKARDLEYWKNKLLQFCNSEKAKPYLDYVRDHMNFEHFIAPQHKLFPVVAVDVVSDPPEKALGHRSENWLMTVFSPLIDSAKNEVQITSPYFVPGKAGTERLCSLVKNGADVRILTNSLAATDVAAVHGGYAPYRKPLLKGGTKLYELKPDGGPHRLRLFGSGRASLHTKAFLIDGKTAFIGSFNFDPRSASLNTEMGILFECPPIADRLNRLFSEETTKEMSYHLHLNKKNKIYWDFIEDGKPRIAKREPESRIWRRAFARIISWLPIQSQL